MLITGGTGMLGGVFAEHLVTGYGVRHLLLVSRRGPAAPGAVELQQRLTGLGAQVTITACDTATPTSWPRYWTPSPARHRLSAVIHTAGVLDDAVISELTGEQLDTVLAAKADSRLASASADPTPGPGRVYRVLLSRGSPRWVVFFACRPALSARFELNEPVTLGRTPVQADLLRSTVNFCEGRLAPDLDLRAASSRVPPCCSRMSYSLTCSADVGRRSVPPMIVAVVMVLQRLGGAARIGRRWTAFTFDLRWKYAAGGLDFDYPGFVHTVLVDMRARLGGVRAAGADLRGHAARWPGRRGWWAAAGAGLDPDL